MRFIQIDEEGYFSSSGVRLTDENYGRKLLSTLTCEKRVFYVYDNTLKILVEAFDEPLVARHIESVSKTGIVRALLPYGLTSELSLDSFRVDLWDRFHARTNTNLPVVFSRSAQMDLFDLADEYDDESLSFHGRRFLIEPLEPNTPIEAGAASKIITPNESIPPVESLLSSILPQIKLPVSRICVLDSPSGSGAAHFAQQGHVVTDVDTREALDFARIHRGEFDLVFEHTLLCSITPAKRLEAVDAWSRLLLADGHLLAIFNVMDRAYCAPFGATEWEIRELLKTKFEFLYWTRWQHSPPQQLGTELVVYARKKA